MIIKAAKRIFNSGKICHSYSDLNFGVTFLEHSVVWERRRYVCKPFLMTTTSQAVVVGTASELTDLLQNKWPLDRRRSTSLRWQICSRPWSPGQGFMSSPMHGERRSTEGGSTGEEEECEITRFHFTSLFSIHYSVHARRVFVVKINIGNKIELAQCRHKNIARIAKKWTICSSAETV